MDIRQLADELVDSLRPGCQRIEIAGSIRRGKADPKDIEIVAIEWVHKLVTKDMFGHITSERSVSGLVPRIEELRRTWIYDPIVKRDGPKYKRLRHVKSGICCDLFLTLAETWGNIFTIRTGPGDFSQALVTRALDLGMKQDGGKLWRVHRDDTRTVIPCPEEADFFAALKVPYLEPQQRTVEALRKVLA